MKIGITQLRQIIQEEYALVLLKENKKKAQDMVEKISMNIRSYGSYAVKSLIEDYQYFMKQMGKEPSSWENFLAGLTFSIDEYGVIHLNSTEVNLTWNDEEKKWEGEGFESPEMITRPTKVAPDDVELPTTYHLDFNEEAFKTNKAMLKKFPGAIAGLKALFQDIGFLYNDEEIDFPTYIGVADVYLDDATFEDGRKVRTVSIQDPEGVYTWDPKDRFWVQVEIDEIE